MKRKLSETQRRALEELCQSGMYLVATQGMAYLITDGKGRSGGKYRTDTVTALARAGYIEVALGAGVRHVITDAGRKALEGEA